LIFSLLISPFGLYAQGLLPPSKNSQPAQNTPQPSYVLIGNKTPGLLLATDLQGNPQNIFSYKTDLEIIVIEFLSARCPYNQAAWKDLKKIYDEYHEWHVSFVAVSANSDETAQELADVMAKNGLHYTVVRDASGELTKTLHATATPEMMILDEEKRLRFRGAINDGMLHPEKRPNIQYFRRAIDAVIGHIDAVPDAEPGAFIGCAIH
jgi:peroxiredoxin